MLKREAAFETIGERRLFDRVLIEHYRHRENGLEVLLSPKNCGVAALQIWYRVGSAHEDPRCTGLAHFFEHMMFRGTKRHGLGEYDRILEELGVNGGTNAFTWKDYTAYIQEFPAEALPTVLAMEADRMEGLDLNAENIREEIGAVRDEKQRSLSDPDSCRFDAFFEKAFPGQGSCWPVLGYEKHIRSYTVEDLKNFYRKNYSPDNALLVICGDFSTASVLEAVQRYFGNKTRGRPLPSVRRRLVPGHHEMRQDIALSRLEFNFALGTGSLWHWDFVARLLAGGEASILEKNLVQKEWLLSVSFWLCRAFEEGSFLHFSLTLSEGKNPREVKENFFSILSCPEEHVTESLMRAIAVEMDADHYGQIGRMDDRATLLGENWIYDPDFSGLLDREKKLREFSRDAAVEMIRKLGAADCFELEALPR
jgi:zinc protease